MANDEALREALIELDALRQREAVALRESNALVSCLSAVATSTNPELSLDNLLKAINEVVESTIVAVIGGGGDNAVVLAATDKHLVGLPAPAALTKGRKARRIVSLADVDWWPASEDWPALCSALSAPVKLNEGRGALVCFLTDPTHFH